MNLYVFDMDYTLINADSSTLWCHYLAENKIVANPQAFLLQEKELMEAYDRGQMQVADYIRFSMGALAHLSVAEVDAYCEAYVKSVIPHKIFEEGFYLVQSLKAQGERLLVISASASFIVKKVASLFGLDEVLAVEVKKVADHYATEIEGLPPFKEGKVTALKKWQKDHGFEDATVHFYTDSINDLPLCLVADKVSVVNPGALLLEEANKRHFEVLKWQRTHS